MTEYMGMIWGRYDAKAGGFQPGGASLHSCMTPHGPDAETFIKASAAELKPEHFTGGLAFMFETTLQCRLTQWALHAPHRDVEYQKCWQQLPRLFDSKLASEGDVGRHPESGSAVSSAKRKRSGSSAQAP